MTKPVSSILGIALLAASTTLAGEPGVTLVVRADEPGVKINPAMWGIFFEDINFAADGGLYAELVKNRSFEFPNAMMGWSAPKRTISLKQGDVTSTFEVVSPVEIRTDNPLNPASPHYLRLRGDFARTANEGFRGMGIRAGESYNFSVYCKIAEGQPALLVELIGSDGKSLAFARVKDFSSKWEYHTATLRATATDPKAHLTLTTEGLGVLDLDMVSLFPANTWKKRKNGLRADLVQMLADLKPGFMRFPGGCIVEGRTLTNRYDWKNSIGHVANRKLNLNRWNVEFANRGRGAADYYQTYGLGFFEYFQLCEDIGAEPMPILNCGMACQFNSGELVPLEQLDSYIQDALDLIEFANGSKSTMWGAKRVAMGHPKPFNLKLLGIGNEQWGPQYIERYTKFATVLNNRHPEIQLISAVGPDPSGERFDFLWEKLREQKANLIDEHFYRPPDWFFTNANRYDTYDRQGPKVFAGEYAAHVRSRANTLETAIAEAAVMTGFERNADVVRMASYAPLFAHVDAWQWRPNLIWFDNLKAVATPDYYVQQMFSVNRGDEVLPLEIQGAPTNQFFASSTRDKKSGEVILKVVNATTNEFNTSIQINGIKSLREGHLTVLTSTNLNAENSMLNPRAVAPVVTTFPLSGTNLTQTFPPQSVSVLRTRVK